MISSFERFGITHLSASSLNLWKGAPGVWMLKYIAKIKDGGSPAMWRGTAVENGLAALLRKQTMEFAVNAAYQSFDQNAANYEEVDGDLTAERELISPMLEQCAKWEAPSALNATQLRIEHYFDPIPIPVIGYIDFAFDGLDVDCKTTKALPSAPRADHVRQVSIYRAARQRAGGLLYLTGKKRAYYDITDEMMEEALAELAADALALNNFLARCDTRADIIKSLPIDWQYYQAPKVKIPLSEILMAG